MKLQAAQSLLMTGRTHALLQKAISVRTFVPRFRMLLTTSTGDLIVANARMKLSGIIVGRCNDPFGMSTLTVVLVRAAPGARISSP